MTNPNKDTIECERHPLNREVHALKSDGPKVNADNAETAHQLDIRGTAGETATYNTLYPKVTKAQLMQINMSWPKATRDFFVTRYLNERGFNQNTRRMQNG